MAMVSSGNFFDANILQNSCGHGQTTWHGGGGPLRNWPTPGIAVPTFFVCGACGECGPAANRCTLTRRDAGQDRGNAAVSSEATGRAPMMPLRELVARYRSLAISFGLP